MGAGRLCAKHSKWETIAVEIANDGGEGVDLDRCRDCGAYRLSWWWPKDSADTKLQSGMSITEEDAQGLTAERDWHTRNEIVRGILRRGDARTNRG